MSKEYVAKEIDKIIHDIDKNIAHDNSWQQFEFHFDQVHGEVITFLAEALEEIRVKAGTELMIIDHTEVDDRLRGQLLLSRTWRVLNSFVAFIKLA